MTYALPRLVEPDRVGPTEIVLVASGDLRSSANRVCWPAQESMEGALVVAFERLGLTVRRGHAFDDEKGHGFIDSQAAGIEVFSSIDPDARLVVAEAVWQYSHHVLPGLRTHRGPILVVANWSGEWPGLVGVLNLNASLTKAGVPYSTLWSEDFTDDFFMDGLRSWLETGGIGHDQTHIKPLDYTSIPAEERNAGIQIARHLLRTKAVLGVFDEGCMGMYNAVFEDDLLNRIGIYKERLSQSSLLAEMRHVTDEEADSARSWLEDKGMVFVTGTNPKLELTDDQIRDQLRMYFAAVRIADDFGCDVIGIQYQQGLTNMAPASDLAEGLLNNEDRPPVRHRETGEILYEGRPVTHFNEVDEGAGVDALVTRRVLASMGLDSAITLHDVRWGAPAMVGDEEQFVWVYMISGSVPPSHNIGGYAGTTSERQPPMYFPSGGGTVKGISRPGEIVWSRVFIEEDRMKIDIGRATVVELSDEETQYRWRETTPQWPIMHAVLHGVSRDQFMARHKANHVTVCYATDADEADRLLAFKAAAFDELGVDVYLSGTTGLD